MTTLRDDFLTIQEFAAELDVPTSRVQAWIRDGHLPAIRLGRLTLIPRDALRRMLERREVRHGA